MGLVDLFIIGAIVHFCMLGLYLVRVIENNFDVPHSENNPNPNQNNGRSKSVIKPGPKGES